MSLDADEGEGEEQKAGGAGEGHCGEGSEVVRLVYEVLEFSLEMYVFEGVFSVVFLKGGGSSFECGLQTEPFCVC